MLKKRADRFMSDLRNRIALDRIPYVKEKRTSRTEDPIAFAHGLLLVGNKRQAELANDCVE